MKAAIDADALIDMFSSASAKQGEQLRNAVCQATLGALQGRELSLKNIRDVLKTMTKAASAGAAQNTGAGVDVEQLLDKAVSGMDDALLKAVEANRKALQQFADQGVGVQEKQLKKAVQELEKMEDTFIGVLQKAADAASEQMGRPWGAVLEKLQAGGTLSGAQASSTAEQFAQMQTAMRDSRAAGLKAAQALAESYTALVSGVLIGMSEALQQGGVAAKATTRKK
ncbi:hypothetical protein BURC_03553 [Burkholderiaceae bacterium]|nr:hypothetical protein BURC_03553 [Burkholderiaceae bacterium]